MPATSAGARWLIPALLLVTASLVAVFAAAEAAWALAALLFVPWLYALDRARSWRGSAA